MPRIEIFKDAVVIEIDGLLIRMERPVRNDPTYWRRQERLYREQMQARRKVKP
jgi:hypothetical protein